MSGFIRPLRTALCKFHPSALRELARYGFWGAATTVLNIGVFQLFYLNGTDYRAANLIALVLTKAAAYAVNKRFVFQSRCASKKELASEIFRFVLSRGVTMIMDYFLLILLTQSRLVSPGVGKVIVTGFVVLVNYVLGKFHVFKRTSGKGKGASL